MSKPKEAVKMKRLHWSMRPALSGGEQTERLHPALLHEAYTKWKTMVELPFGSSPKRDDPLPVLVDWSADKPDGAPKRSFPDKTAA